MWESGWRDGTESNSSCWSKSTLNSTSTYWSQQKMTDFSRVTTPFDESGSSRTYLDPSSRLAIDPMGMRSRSPSLPRTQFDGYYGSSTTMPSNLPSESSSQALLGYIKELERECIQLKTQNVVLVTEKDTWK